MCSRCCRRKMLLGNPPTLDPQDGYTDLSELRLIEIALTLINQVKPSLDKCVTQMEGILWILVKCCPFYNA